MSRARPYDDVEPERNLNSVIHTDEKRRLYKIRKRNKVCTQCGSDALRWERLTFNVRPNKQKTGFGEVGSTAHFQCNVCGSRQHYYAILDQDQINGIVDIASGISVGLD